ncbi:ATP-dependent DNA helicase DinG [Virgibacillus sp. LDC-1]|uniref:ATP-dependent DNA helicase DinG n=1 Tax=Virgibacillus sp. LDC-1 TaxID=3039856 RepID=UPI0024DE56F9|nr:ATP-dependent DNA helicase DinG [Virgibacillus sp. LDC-1]
MTKYVVFDLETTGHSPNNGDKIIEIGIVVIEDFKIVADYTTLLNPGKPIPPFITNLTGIDDKAVESAPCFTDVASKITSMFKDSFIIAHNVPFDLGFLNEALPEAGYTMLENLVIDTVELARILIPQAPSFKLGQLAQYLNITHDDPHRALSDAYVTAKLFLALKEKLFSLPFETVQQLMKIETKLQSNLEHLLTQHLELLRFSSSTNEEIVSFHGLAFKKQTDLRNQDIKLDMAFGEYLDTIYAPKGGLEKSINNFESRPGQQRMSECIFDSFQSKQHALIEAETGTGKSFAYLIPAIYHAVRTKKRVVVSTHTTQLQSQLLNEEIPVLKRLLNFPFQVALMKGKQHYISLEKVERELSKYDADNYDIALTKAMLLVWLTETNTGDLDEINFPAGGYSFIRKVSTESEDYTNPHSPWFTYSYYHRARKLAEHADIVILNHALLCTDVFNDYQHIPSYDYAIIDEGHHLEAVASQHCGLKLDYVHLLYTLNQIGSGGDGNWLATVRNTYPALQSAFTIEACGNLFNDLKQEVDDLFRGIYHYVHKKRYNRQNVSDIGRIQYRINHEDFEDRFWNTIQDMAARLRYLLQKQCAVLTLIEKETEVDIHVRDEAKKLKDILQQFHESIHHMLITRNIENDVRWIEAEGGGPKNAVYLYSEPTNLSALLEDSFFLKKKSIILTSATLSIKGSFSFIRSQLGMPKERTVEERIASPFDYKEQVRLFIPNDFPDIKQGDLDDFVYSTCEAIVSMAEITKGRMLVLFTSYEMLKQTYFFLKETMNTEEYYLIAQGLSSGSRERLKKNFQTFDKAILLGTSSFWEGVDIPGEDLSCVMIVRLPFQPPNHPVYEAKANALKEAGKNAFMELALPNAVIRFKQGFGRLIRSKSDRGIVFVCDARIKKARYGKYFLESIPDVQVSYGNTSKIMDEASIWFNKKSD